MTSRKPVLLWSAFPAYADIYRGVPSPDPRLVMQTYEERKALLDSKGIELKLVVPPFNWWKELPFTLGRRVKKQLPRSLISLSHENDEGKKGSLLYLRALEWPRDIVQSMRGKIYAHKQDLWRVNALLKDLGISTAPITSPLGEGGLHTGTDTFRVIGNHPMFNEVYEHLEREKYTVYKMPVHFHLGNRQDRAARLLRKRTGKNSHMDTEVNVAVSGRKKPLFVVSNHYYQLFPEQVDLLVYAAQGTLHVANEQETASHAINFLTLPDGSVVIPNDCPETISALEKELGNENVFPIAMLPHERETQGGLRCRTSVI